MSNQFWNKVLIVSDSAERIPHLQTGFDSQEVEIASAVFPEEWAYVSGDIPFFSIAQAAPLFVAYLDA